MKKKLSVFLIVLLATCMGAQANAPDSVATTITDVVLFQQGAQVMRTASVSLQKGDNILVFNNLTAQLIPPSVQVKSSAEEATILSVVHEMNFLNMAGTDQKIIELQNKQKALQDSITLQRRLLTVYKEEKSLILSNKTVAGTDGIVDVQQLQAASDFFRTRLTEIELKEIEINKTIREYNKQMVQIAGQLLELNVRTEEPTSDIRVKVNAKQALTAEFELQYLVNNAGWTPEYDIRIQNVSQPIALVYKADVHQNTGEDWDNVNLVLSTGNPAETAQKPELDTYRLTFNNYYRSETQSQQTANSVMSGTGSATIVAGVVVDSEGSPLPGATIQVKGQEAGTVADIYGSFQLQILPEYGTNVMLTVSYVGFASKEIPATPNMRVVMDENSEALEEVVVAGYQNHSLIPRPLRGRVAGVQIGRNRGQRSYREEEQAIPLSVKRHETSTEFEIDVPYTIPADNKNYDVEMVRYQIPADFEYSCVPKLNDNAFLMARITDWENLHLLSGNAGIFFENTFKGSSFLDLEGFEDTLVISVGADKNISIKREKIKDYERRQFIGANRTEFRAWEITIRNNKQEAIDIVVTDQYPVASNNDIKVELIEHSNASLDEKNGMVTWRLHLEPQETATRQLIYSVKYPKFLNLIVE